MPLPLTVSLIVLAVIVIIGVAGYLIDESAERHEQPPDTRDRRD